MIKDQQIFFKLEGATPEELVRYQEILHVLLLSLINGKGVIGKNGSIVLHFDHEGRIQESSGETKLWKRNKIEGLANFNDRVKIEITK